MTLLLIITADTVHALPLPSLAECLSRGAPFVPFARVFCVMPMVAT